MEKCILSVWLDVRTSKIVDDLLKTKGTQCVNAVVQCSGLPLSTYFSSVKLKWLLQNVTAVKEAVELGECLAGTVDSWLIWVSLSRKYNYHLYNSLFIKANFYSQ